jgi:hypothetical protein
MVEKLLEKISIVQYDAAKRQHLACDELLSGPRTTKMIINMVFTRW